MKKVFLCSIFCFLLIILCSCFETSTIHDSKPKEENQTFYEYVVKEDSAILTKYIGEYTEYIRIPEEIDGIKISGIASGCFSSNRTKPRRLNDETSDTSEDHKTFYIGDNIENIESGAFDEKDTFIVSSGANKDNWKDESVKNSEDGAVYDGIDEKDVVTKEGIVYLYNYSLHGYDLIRCLTQRKVVNIPDYINNEPVINIKSRSFYDNNHVEEVNTSKFIGYIWHHAFQECKNLKKITFVSQTLTKILAEAFMNCESLNEIVLPPMVSYIQPRAFTNCGTISSITVPTTLTSLSDNVFLNTFIEKVIYLGTEDIWNIFYFGEGNDTFKNAIIEIKGVREDQTLDKLREIEEIEVGVMVTYTGVISGFYGNANKLDSLMIQDLDENYFIYTYTGTNCEFINDEYIGRVVDITGMTTLYNGQVEVKEPTISFNEDESIHEIKIRDVEINYLKEHQTELIGQYVQCSGTVTNRYEYGFNLDNVDFSFFQYMNIHPYIVDGMEITIKGWLIKYNQICEVVMSKNELIKLSNLSE